MIELPFRFRRLRQSAGLRALVRESSLSVSDLVLPLFVEETIASPVAIASMPGVVRYPESMLAEVVARAWARSLRPRHRCSRRGRRAW